MKYDRFSNKITVYNRFLHSKIHFWYLKEIYPAVSPKKGLV